MLDMAESSRRCTPKAIKLTWHPVGFPTNRAGCKPIQASREQSPCRCEAIGHCQAAAGHSGSQMDFAIALRVRPPGLLFLVLHYANTASGIGNSARASKRSCVCPRPQAGQGNILLCHQEVFLFTSPCTRRPRVSHFKAMHGC